MNAYGLPVVLSDCGGRLGLHDTTTELGSYSPSLSAYLDDIKKRMGMGPYQAQWDIYKKYTNPYEYIHSPVPQRKRPVARYKPLSRSFFKLTEMIQAFDLLPQGQGQAQGQGPSVHTFHMAEGPGGFIEAVVRHRGAGGNKDQYVGMTVQDDADAGVPGWKKSRSLLESWPGVYLEGGMDGTGNLFHVHNFDYCVQTYGGTMDFVTADGGFDFSVHFEEQESRMIPLLYAEILYAVSLQKAGGHFVLKVFDTFHPATVDLLYWLSSMYRQVIVCKPCTSRVANSEKYVVCKHFVGKHDDVQALLWRHLFTQVTTVAGGTFRFFKIPLPLHFRTRIEDINAIFGQQQLENIHFTLSNIDRKPAHDKLEGLIRQHVQKCQQWCTRHRLASNDLKTFF